MKREPKAPYIPKLRHHKASNRGVATLNGKDFYFGPWGHPATRAAYDAKIAWWLQRGRTLPTTERDDPAKKITVATLAVRYWNEHGKTYYLTRGELSHAAYAVKRVLKMLGARFDDLPADEFGPKRLKEFRDIFLDEHAPDPEKPDDVRPACRRVTVNRYMTYVLAAFDWGVAEEILPPSTAHALRSLKPLRKGRTTAKESEAIPPAPQESIDAILACGKEPLVTLARFQLATGARPTEACSIRLSEIDRSADPWIYRPTHHKTEHHGKARAILIGPKGQAAIADAIKAAEATGDPAAPLFPAKRGDGSPIVQYVYRRLIRRVCQAAGVEVVSPNQFRHNAATAIRKEFGIEAASVILGHSSTKTTEIYAERDVERAAEIAKRIG